MAREPITLEMLGWDLTRAEEFAPCHARGLAPGRVAVEDKHYYVVLTSDGPLTGQVSGKLLHLAESSAGLPKVGDWVAVSLLPNESKAIIHQVLQRKTKISRRGAGRDVEEQVLATNVDVAFVVQGLDRSFRPALLQRHLVTVLESGAKPVVVLNKSDLCPDLPGKVEQARAAAGADVPWVVVSAKTRQGLPELQRWIQPGQTIVFIGSSGVGKSSLINDLYGEEVQATAEVRERDAKGRHVTTWRELILLPSGGLVIDTPGMREFQMWMADEGIHGAFPDMDALALNCHFRDCSHTVEKKCAVLEAVAQGQLAPERYQRYLKLKRELQFLEEAQTKHSWMNRRRQARAAQRAFNKVKRS